MQPEQIRVTDFLAGRLCDREAELLELKQELAWWLKDRQIDIRQMRKAYYAKENCCFRITFGDSFGAVHTFYHNIPFDLFEDLYPEDLEHVTHALSTTRISIQP